MTVTGGAAYVIAGAAYVIAGCSTTVTGGAAYVIAGGGAACTTGGAWTGGAWTVCCFSVGSGGPSIVTCSVDAGATCRVGACGMLTTLCSPGTCWIWGTSTFFSISWT